MTMGPLLYVFLDTSDLPAKRRTLEEATGFVPVEFDPHAPHQHHGVVKYDAGPVIVALNLGARPPVAPWSHALSMVVSSSDPTSVLSRAAGTGCVIDADGGRFCDVDGHMFMVARGGDHAPRASARATVRELRLTVRSVSRSVDFYRGQLDLRLLQERAGSAVLSTGNLRLSLHQQAGNDLRTLDRRGYLIVFHSPELGRTHSVLRSRGVAFHTDIQDTEIGLTCRFADPDHNALCLYEPSAESLGWGAGEKMLEIAGAARSNVTPRPSPPTDPADRSPRPYQQRDYMYLKSISADGGGLDEGLRGGDRAKGSAKRSAGPQIRGRE
jgi:catechol 2,3-dioxygenase-like lactoylglutathione lyase family enzyme